VLAPLGTVKRKAPKPKSPRRKLRRSGRRTQRLLHAHALGRAGGKQRVVLELNLVVEALLHAHNLPGAVAVGASNQVGVYRGTMAVLVAPRELNMKNTESAMGRSATG
jgi:hypothetical protein